MIHLVYPHGERHVAPWSIGNHVAAGLREAGHEVIQWDWEDPCTIEPNRGDILIGHPHPQPGRVFLNSLDHHGWGRRIALSPFNGSPEDLPFIEGVIHRVDLWLSICGPRWASELRWPNAKPIDMAIEPSDFPPLKDALRPPGRRRFLYVGCTLANKGTDLLRDTAARLPEESIGHIGWGVIPGVCRHGYVDTASEAGRALIGGYDFLLSPGLHDANPTTVLEASCWGLIALATAGSGWGEDIRGEAMPSEPDAAAAFIRNWQRWPGDGASIIRARRERAKHYSWQRLVSAVLEAL